MRYDAGTTDIPTAGTAAQISNTLDKVKAISVRCKPGNVGNIAFGVSDVTMTNGWTLRPGESKAVHFGEGSVLFSTFWVNAANNGDDAEWDVVLE